jgi:hypothetical protein
MANGGKERGLDEDHRQIYLASRHAESAYD